MKKSFRAALTKATERLSKELDPDNELKPLLESRSCLTSDQHEEAYSHYKNPTRAGRVLAILCFLKLSDDSKYEVFRECLKEIGREDLANDCLPADGIVVEFKKIVSHKQIPTVTESRCEGQLDLSTFLIKFVVRHVITSPEGRTSGITAVGNEIFVARYSSEILVFNSTTFAFSRRILIPGSRELQTIVSCSCVNCKCLYLTDNGQKIIHRYDLSSKASTNWPVMETCPGLSVTKSSNVLVMLCADEHMCLQEYTTNGVLLKEIRLDDNIDQPRHCKQSLSGNFVICQRYKVSIVDPRGQFIKSYFEQHNGQRSTPTRIVTDAHDNVLISDVNDNRLIVLSSALAYVGDVKIHALKDYKINPYALYFDEQNHRLYVGEFIGGRIFVLECMYQPHWLR